MRLLFAVASVFFSSWCCAQQRVTYSDSVKLKDFKEQVIDGMNRHHRKHRTNDFYNFNVVKTPVYESADTIIYNVKLLTSGSGLLLWGAKGMFTKTDNQLQIVLSDIRLLKKSSMKGVDYIDVAVNDMEATKGNQINLESLKRSTILFFSCFK